MTNGNYHAAYSYLENSPLVGQITFNENTTTRMTTTKAYDKLNRLTRIASSGAGVSPASSFGHLYENAYPVGEQRVLDRCRFIESTQSVWPTACLGGCSHGASQCLRRETAVRLRWGWIAERLRMGTPGRVNQLLYRERLGRKAKGK